MKKKIRVAQIGVGHDHAIAAMKSILAQKDIFDVAGVCVCEEEEARYEKNKAIYGQTERRSLEDILNDRSLDGVVIETWEKNLTRYAGMAVEKGLHFHMDKPGSVDPDAFQNLMSKAKAKKLTAHLGYMYRYNPAFLEIKEKIKAGMLGEIYSVEAHMDCLHPANKRQWLDQFPGGMMFFLGCHLVDLIVQLQGIPEEIMPYNCSTGFDGVTGEDFGMALFRYKHGISFAKTCAAEPGGFLRRQLVVCGEKGTIELKPIERYMRHADGTKDMMTDMAEIYKEEAEKGGWNHPADHKEIGPNNRYDTMMASFAAMVRGEKENPQTYEYEVQLHRILLKACGVDIDFKKEIVL